MLTMVVQPDQDAEDPRSVDRLGTMVCFHRRYRLGDDTDYRRDWFDGWEQMEKYILAEGDVAVILPVYLHDHSGLTMSTTPFSCRWDSGQVGFIWVTTAQASAWGCRDLSPSALSQLLTDEVSRYSTWVGGDVVGYQIWDGDEFIAGCSGYYSMDDARADGEAEMAEILAQRQRAEVAG